MHSWEFLRIPRKLGIQFTRVICIIGNFWEFQGIPRKLGIQFAREMRTAIKTVPSTWYIFNTRPCEQGNWDTWLVLGPWIQVYIAKRSVMAVGRSCICSASILFLFLFCCLSRSLCHPSTFLFGFCRVLSDGEVAMNIDEMDLYLAICSSCMKSTRHLGLQSSTRTSCYFTLRIPYTPNSISTFNVTRLRLANSGDINPNPGPSNFLHRRTRSKSNTPRCLPWIWLQPNRQRENSTIFRRKIVVRWKHFLTLHINQTRCHTRR